MATYTPQPTRTNRGAYAQGTGPAPSSPKTSDDPGFTRGPARRPMPAIVDPVLQWASGLPTADRRFYAGWLLETGKGGPELHQAMHEAGFEKITIRHGSGNVVEHWRVDVCNAFIVAEGLQSIAEMQQTRDRFGIAFGWFQNRSYLRARVFMHELLAVGYTLPLQISIKGTITGDFLAAAGRQFDVFDAIAAYRAQAQKPPRALPFYACSIPLAAGGEVIRGTGGATKEIAPIVSWVPQGTIPQAYIMDHWIDRAWVPLIESHLDQTIAWSVAVSAQIAEGAEGPGAAL